jgi:hypothetical protein
MDPGSVSLLGCLVPSAFPLDIPQQYQIFATDNLRKKVWIFLKLLLKLLADFQAMLLLFIWQESWHKLPRNPPHVLFL